MSYLEKFLQTKTAIDLLPLFQQRPKEITESMAMLYAYNKFIRKDGQTVVVVGDGNTPRTGALIAYFTKANVISIDPIFNEKAVEEWYEYQRKVNREPNRLSLVKGRIEDNFDRIPLKDVVFLWPHSHANIDCMDHLDFESRYDITMPCCVPLPKKWLSTPHIHYVDYNVNSAKRDIYIFKRIKTEENETTIWIS